MLEFDDQAFGRLDVGYVELTTIIPGGDFLPNCREVVLPVPMPVGFVFPPVVTVPLTLVRPMPDFPGSAPGDQFCATTRALAFCAWCRFDALMSMYRKAHTTIPELVSA